MLPAFAAMFCPRRLRWFFGALLLLLLATTGAWAQEAAPTDVITDLQGNEIQGQVVEITPTQVLYRAPDTDPALPPAVLDKKTLFMVRFANGTKEVFGAAPVTPPVVGMASGAALGSLSERAALRQRGIDDANRFYNRAKPFWGTAGLTMVTFGSILPAVVIGVIKPRAEKNQQLNAQLLLSPDYVNAYEKRAHQRKALPVVGGYLVGTTAIIMLIAASLNGM